jgi:hypothetical protein
MLMAETAQYRRYRAPQEDGQVLVDPPRATLADVVARNRRHLVTLEYDFQGRSLDELSASARRSLLERAFAYTSQYRDADNGAAAINSASSAPLVLSGHQPQLYHPGVWYKNFVLGQLAREVGGVGVHLLIDSDSCRTASIRVPTGSVCDPRVEAVPMDLPAAEVPYEERVIQDESLFAIFPTRVSALLRPFIEKPLVNELWPLIRKRDTGDTNLGRRMAQGRHALEASWGNETLELPQSCVCGLAEFNWFLAHLLANLPRFQSAYNASLESYRRAHGMRNRAHPVPDLAAHDGWLEAPFWIWSSDDPRRQPLFAQQRGRELVISDRGERKITLTLSADGDAAVAAEQLRALAKRGIKIRTRALSTTLFARLVLGDLFLHGIGGAKYDQVTNQIAEHFFGFALPEFGTVSATLRLPIDHPCASVEQSQTLRQQLRELDYHPERYLSTNGTPASNQLDAAASIVAEKQRWISTPTTPTNAHSRHLGITGANAALQPFVAGVRHDVNRRLNEANDCLRTSAILSGREYSFALFPRERLQRLMLGTAPSLD